MDQYFKICSLVFFYKKAFEHNKRKWIKPLSEDLFYTLYTTLHTTLHTTLYYTLFYPRIKLFFHK